MALTFRFAQETDTLLILQFIRELADYEHLLDQVVADEATLRDQLWNHGMIRTELVEDAEEAQTFLNFSTFLGRAGLYLEDLYVRPEHRGKGYGKAFFRRLAAIAAGADGLIIEVHNDPPHALCDGAQSITPAQFDTLMGRLTALAPCVGREL
jgi:GNAT superfamily N-acetyltransferase